MSIRHGLQLRPPKVCAVFLIWLFSYKSYDVHQHQFHSCPYSPPKDDIDEEVDNIDHGGPAEDYNTDKSPIRNCLWKH